MWGAYDFSTRQRQTPNSIQTMVQLLTVNTRVYIYIYIYIIRVSWEKLTETTQYDSAYVFEQNNNRKKHNLRQYFANANVVFVFYWI